MHRHRHQGFWVAGIWLAVALINATQSVVGLRGEAVNRPMTPYFIQSFLGWLVWACATPFVLWLGHRFPPVRSAGVRPWPVHLAACAAIAMTNAAWATLLNRVIHPWGTEFHQPPFHVAMLIRFLNQIHVSLIMYAAILAIEHTIESRRRAARLSTQLVEAQLDALRRQLEPHFLFNTLNAIAGLVRDQKNDAAVGMIARLSDLLRRVLSDAGRQLVPLAEEMEFLERYLEIQRMRFAERLHAAIDVPRELHAAQVPSLILQPLVENAIQHGIGRSEEGGTVQIAAVRAGGVLTMRVYNDGPPLEDGWKEGIGLSNTRARLNSLFGEESGLTIRNCAGGVEAIVTLPYRTMPA
jgi:two-component system, LytTR family, sensor kinase